MRIIFMGSPEFALPTLGRLIESEHEVVAVVTQPDRLAGRHRSLRPPPAKELGEAHGLPVLQPERVNSPDSLDALRAYDADAITIAAYGQILRQPLLDIPRKGIVNVHASLLPKFRGASPIAAAILAGERETGVTIIEVVLKLDAGPALASRSQPIAPEDTSGTLSKKLAALGADLLIETLPAWERGGLTPQPQDDVEASYMSMVRREDAVIDWSLPATEVWRAVRAYNPWPMATTTVEGESLRLLEGWPLEVELDVPAGTVVDSPENVSTPDGSGFAVRCGQGLLAVTRAQRAGRRALRGDELLRGYQGLIGKRLGV